MAEKIAIIGAGGLTGRELLKLLSFHEGFEVVHITSNQVNGKKLKEFNAVKSLDVEELPAGVYILRILTEDHKISELKFRKE